MLALIPQPNFAIFFTSHRGLVTTNGKNRSPQGYLAFAQDFGFWSAFEET